MVKKPWFMPNSLSRTLATGQKAFESQMLLDTRKSEFLSIMFSLTPTIIVLSTSSSFGEFVTIQCLIPLSFSFLALKRFLWIPDESMTISTPASCQGTSAISALWKSLIFSRSTYIFFSSARMSLSSLPYVESYFKRYAIFWLSGLISLIATISK